MANVDAELATDDLAEDVRAYLAEAGIGSDDSTLEHPGVRVFVGLLESSWSLEEASEVLGVSTDEVIARLARGELHGFALAHGLRVPVWQMLGGRPIPGLVRLLDGVPRGVHPAALQEFMTTPDHAWHDMSPMEWLVTGGPVEPLVDWMRRRWGGSLGC